MDYEKAYKESFEAAKGLHDAGNALTKKQMEIVFPQLAESEDERIRKEIISIVKEYGRICEKEGDPCCTIGDCLAYLEKQKEQKPAEWSEEDKNKLYRVIETLLGDKEAARHETPQHYDVLCKAYDELIDFLKSLPKRFHPQPKKEWSEEDEDMLNSCISSIEEAKENRYAYKETDGDTSYDHEIAWLKSIRPVGKESLQPHWKPSEEQMRTLWAVWIGGDTPVMMALGSLLEDLKKLM